ncbi:hypothetical protein CPB83DRAFT_400166 [Crepidotus variabilis]|uniref:F-box domain-containing protein n=1 Tax=Crepidotus variabilis TaxID=179855 RepID=A0A9P6EE46_9AGAR|nr:hypothetical protein CPB83DRAFT_400166 [Crepidotus variabilis]
MEHLSHSSLQPLTEGPFNLSTLPNEILSHIFHIGQGLHDEEAQPEPRIKPFEVLVSQICLHMRHTALHQPTLWSTIRLRPFSSYERIAEYLKRSAQTPLNIHIRSTSSINQEKEIIPDALLDLVLNHSLRWQSMSVAEGNSLVSRICNHPAPSLRYLSLSVDEIEVAGINAAVNMQSPKIFSNGTNDLRFIRLRGSALHLYRPRFNMVITLHLEETKEIPLTYDDFRNIVLCSPFLANLSFYGDIIASSERINRKNDLTLPALRSLRIYGVSGVVYASLLRAIKAPNLEALTLKGLQEHDLDALQDMMEDTKFQNLRYLKFCDFDVSVYTYETIMRIFENITYFCTPESFIFDSNLVRLLLDDSEEMGKVDIRWPSLKEVSFPSDEEKEEDEIELLDDLINSRQNDGCAMRRVLFEVAVDDPRNRSSEDRKGVQIVYSSKQEGWPCSRNLREQDDLFAVGGLE